MTDKLHCPFCGAELQTHTMTPGRTLICVNKGCPVDSVVMKRIIWQTLIDGKKAQDALGKMSLALTVAEEFIGGLDWQCNPQKVLDEITSITKQEE